jgi:hypothetical protein
MAGPADELKMARTILGWDHEQLGRALRLAGTPEKRTARVREMEMGKRDISGPVQVAIEALMSGWRPNGWTDAPPT